MFDSRIQLGIVLFGSRVCLTKIRATRGITWKCDSRKRTASYHRRVVRYYLESKILYECETNRLTRKRLILSETILVRIPESRVASLSTTTFGRNRKEEKKK